MTFSDLGKIDEYLPFTIDDTITIFLTVIGSFCVAIWANWFSAIIAVPMVIFLVYMRGYYLRTAREVKRLDSILRSPIYNHISSTVMGRSSIKSFNLGKFNALYTLDRLAPTTNWSVDFL